LGYGGAATTYLGIENGVILNVVVQIAKMYCYSRFNRRSAKHLHSSSKNTKKNKIRGVMKPPLEMPGRPTLAAACLSLNLITGPQTKHQKGKNGRGCVTPPEKEKEIEKKKGNAVGCRTRLLDV